MPAFEDGLYEHVTGTAPIAAIIGTRFWRSRGDETPPTPYAIYKTLHKGTGVVMEGLSGLSDRLVQVSLFGSDQDSVSSVDGLELLEDLAEEFRRALTYLRGEHLGTTSVRAWVEGFDIQSELFEHDTALHHIPCQFSIMHSESKD